MKDFDWSGWSGWKPLATLNFSEVPTDAGAHVIATGKPIPRAIEVDSFGFLDVGETNGLRQRLKDFHRCTRRDDEGHMAAWRYAFFKFERHFPIDTLPVRWAIASDKPVAYALEGKILLEYIKVHCELPPLNYQFNWTDFDKMKAYFDSLPLRRNRLRKCQ